MFVPFVSPAKTAEPIEMVFGGLRLRWAKDSRIRWGSRYHEGNGQFLGVVRPIQKALPVSAAALVAKYNNDTTCDAAFDKIL